MTQLLAYDVASGAIYCQNDKGSCEYICPRDNKREMVRGGEATKAIKRGFIADTREFATDKELETFLLCLCEGSVL